MKNSQLILEEIKRINEIMGGKKNPPIMEMILLEQPNPKTFEMGVKFFEELIESLGFKNLDKVNEKNLEQIFDRLEVIDSAVLKKFPAEVKEAIAKMRKRRVVDASGKRLTPRERLQSVIDSMVKNADAMEKSLAEASIKASAQMDSLFVKLFDSPIGQNTRAVFERIANEPRYMGYSTENIITNMRRIYPTEYGKLGDWYWDRLAKTIKKDGTSDIRYADSIENTVFSKSAVESIDAGSTSFVDLLRGLVKRPKQGLDYMGLIEDSQLEGMLEQNPIWNRLSNEKQNEVLQQLANYISTTTVQNMGKAADAMEKEIDELVSLFETSTLTVQQQKNLIKQSLRDTQSKYPWFSLDMENVLRQLTLKDRNGDFLLSPDRYSKFRTTAREGEKLGERVLDSKTFFTQLGLQSLKYWAANAGVALGASLLDALVDKTIPLDETGNNWAEQIVKRSNASKWFQIAILPTNLLYSTAGLAVIKGAFSNDPLIGNERAPELEEILVSKEFKDMFGTVKEGDLVKRDANLAPDYDPSIYGGQTFDLKKSRWLTDSKTQKLNYGVWYYDTDANVAKLRYTPYRNVAPKSEVIPPPNVTYTDDVPGFTKWYANRGENFKTITQGNEWNPGKDGKGYYVKPDGKKRFKFIGGSVGFEPTTDAF